MNDGYFRSYRGDLYIGVRLDPDDEELSKEEFDALLEDIRERDRVRELEQYLASTDWQVIRAVEMMLDDLLSLIPPEKAAAVREKYPIEARDTRQAARDQVVDIPLS